MAKKLSEIVLDLNEFIQFVKDDLDSILFKHIESLRSIILERVRQGKDANGNNFPFYSEFEIDASRFDNILDNTNNPSQARSFIDDAIEEGRKISYLDIRKSAGYTNKTQNYFFSGEMLNSIRVQLVSKDRGKYKFIISPKDLDNRDKLLNNEEFNAKRPILEQSDKEAQIVAKDMEDDIVQSFNKIVGG